MQAVLLVYDVTNQNSFDNLEDWYETVKKLCDKDGSKLPHIALVANKSKLYLKKKKQLYVPSFLEPFNVFFLIVKANHIVPNPGSLIINKDKHNKLSIKRLITE